ncbi:hypothetical protein [Kitasatospora sp. NPDC088346]|uniref:hypothetical protein n=1 Tax=Kitasatospora sp. NPDC088346 TaxID=3364073 RepID=UPI00380278A0
MSEQPHADHLAAVHAALTAEGLPTHRPWITDLTRRPSDQETEFPRDADGGFWFEAGLFHGQHWDEPDSIWLGWEHHRGWFLMDQDSGLMPIRFSLHPLPLSELFAEPTAVAAAVRRWLPGWQHNAPVQPGRWSGADAAEAAVRAWHDQQGTCLGKQDRHLRHNDEVERVAGCRCPYQPCGAVALRDMREDCPWHAVLHHFEDWSSHTPESCPGAASTT